MSRYFPHETYAEEQPYARTILWYHVLHRGIPTGTAVGSAIAPLAFLLRRRQYAKAITASGSASGSGGLAAAAAVPKATTATTPAKNPAFAPILLKSAGRGAAIGTVSVGVALWARMRGREEIEWQDRSWRLLANEGQVLVDDFSIAGMAAGLATALRGSALSIGWAGPLGRAGLGSLVGTAAYLLYQYGIRPATTTTTKTQHGDGGQDKSK